MEQGEVDADEACRRQHCDQREWDHDAYRVEDHGWLVQGVDEAVHRLFSAFQGDF